MKLFKLLLFLLLLFSDKVQSQITKITGPNNKFYGCPTYVFEAWASSSRPNFEWPEYGFESHYSDCYNCDKLNENEVNVCEHYFSGNKLCPTCDQIIRLEDVYNPKIQQYETVYKVIENTQNGNKIWFTYEVISIPIYGTDLSGKRIIVGYRYAWIPIPMITTVLVTPYGLKMLYDEQ